MRPVATAGHDPSPAATGTARDSARPSTFQELLGEILESDNDRLLVAVSDAGNIVGFAHTVIQDSPPYPMFVPRRHGDVVTLVVDEGWREQGIGRALMEEIERWLSDRPYRDRRLFSA